MKICESLLVILAILASSEAHTEGGPRKDIPCNFKEDDRGYVCEISGLKLSSLEDKIRITGQQIGEKTNEDVTYLKIQSSESHYVPSEDIFTYLVNLKKLDMRGVSVKHLTTIINCFPLDMIDLSENLIAELKPGLFIECMDLETLNLSRNKISKIDDNAFSSLNVLTSLDLSENELYKLTRKTVKPLKNLKKLSVRGNKFKELPHDVFNDLFHLQELDISDNPLIRLDFRFFDFLIHLEILQIRNTNIKKLHQFTFKNLRRLRILDLSQNNLIDIDNELLSTNAQLEELRMNNVGMKSMGRQFFDKLNLLKTFHANGNRCVDGSFNGDVVEIRPKFLGCFEAFDKLEANRQSGNSNHSGDEL